LAVALSALQKQTPSLIPEHIQGKLVLAMGIAELQQFVQAQCRENPALVLDDVLPCPFCGVLMVDGKCSVCSLRDSGAAPAVSGGDDDGLWGRVFDVSDDEEALEPLALVASPISLHDHLRTQIRAEFPEEEIPAAELIVDHIDDDGYLREPLVELASGIGLSVPQLEAVLIKVQHLDPLGVGCRDLREYALLQIRRASSRNEESRLAERIVGECWDGLSRMKLNRIARDLGTNVLEVRRALEWMRKNLHPYPTGAFRDPWHRLTPRRVPHVPPDVVVRANEGGLVAEVVDPLARVLKIDEAYEALAAEMYRKPSGSAGEDGTGQLKESVVKARVLLEALEFRRVSLRKITHELIRCQQDFFSKGPTALRPMTRKELAARVGLHESTVCRALQNKNLRLPSGETMSFEVLFDAALPVKERIKQLAAGRLSDAEIAAELAKSGIQVARRTVAKYREQLRLPPREYRVA